MRRDFSIILATTAVVMGLALSPRGYAQSDFTGTFSARFETYGTLHNWDDIDRQASSNLWLMPGARILLGDTQKLSLGATLVLSQKWTGLRETSLASNLFSARLSPLRLNPYLAFSPGAQINLPLNEDQLRRETLILGTALAPRLIFDLAPQKLAFVQDWSGFFQISAKRSFHTYATATTGDSNSRYGLTLWAQLVYSPLTRLSLATDLVRASTWTYGGRIQNSYEIAQEIVFAATPDLELGVGHAIGGSVLAANGIDADIQFFNGRQTQIFGSLTYKFF